MKSSGRAKTYACSRVGCELSTGWAESCRDGLHLWPGDILAVRLAVPQAAVEDADQTVGQDPQRFLMPLLAGAQGVVVAAGAGRSGEGAEGPALAGIGQPVV